MSLTENAAGDHSGGTVSQPPVQAIFLTASWILFSTPGYEVGVRSGSGDGATISPALCSLIAARRSDGALFCAPLRANSHWGGADANNLILANAAGDVVYTRAYIAGPQGAVDPAFYRLYKILLGGTDGPTAVAALDVRLAELQTFQVNATGDLLVKYTASTMDPVTVSRIVPLDGSEPTVVPGKPQRLDDRGRGR